MKVYITGQVTGLNYSKAAAKFWKMETQLVSEGVEVLNPIKIVNDEKCDWNTAMRKCITALMTADAILLLDNAHNSRGALIELDLANELEMPIYHTLMDFINRKK